MGGAVRQLHAIAVIGLHMNLGSQSWFWPRQAFQASFDSLMIDCKKKPYWPVLKEVQNPNTGLVLGTRKSRNPQISSCMGAD